MHNPSATLFLRACTAVVAASALLALSATTADASTTADRPAAGTSGASSKAVTIALSDANVVPSASILQSELTSDKTADCAGKAESAHASLTEALSEARSIEDKAGRSKVGKVDAGRDTKPADAELDATSAEAAGDPVGALAALLAAYDKDPRSRVVLDGLGAVLGQLGEHADAIALLDKAATIGGTLQHPTGISEQATELNDRGYALLGLHQWAAAASVLSQAVAKAPTLDAAKLNLAGALTCQGKNAQAARMLIAGALPGDHTTIDETGDTEIPPGEIMDTSLGKAGVWPQFSYPETAGDIIKDGQSFYQFEQDAFNAINSDSANGFATAIWKLPPVSRNRIFDLANYASDPVLGGWATDKENAAADQSAALTLWQDVMGLGGTQDTEIDTLIATGDNICTLQPEYQQWLTQQTETFHADIVDWDADLHAWWTAESKWASGVFANIKDPAMAADEADFLDETKQSNIELITDAVWNWEAAADLGLGTFSDSSCADATGPDENPPSDPKETFAGCPDSLKRASFKISLGILKISVNCEKVSVSAQSGWIGPFAKVSAKYNGDMTITVGAKVGGSIGPVSAGAEAGMSVSVVSGQLADASVTAGASLTASGGPINLTAGSANATVGLENVVSAMYNLVQ